MHSGAAILVMESEGIYARFAARFSPRRQRVVLAATIVDARYQLSSLRPWLVVVATEQADPDLVSLLIDIRGKGTKILGVHTDGAPARVEWADRVVPVSDFDQVARAASALFLEYQYEAGEATSLYGVSTDVAALQLKDGYDEETTSVNESAGDDPSFEPDDDTVDTVGGHEAWRREQEAARQFASMLAAETPMPVLGSEVAPLEARDTNVADQQTESGPAATREDVEQVGLQVDQIQAGMYRMLETLEDLRDKLHQLENAGTLLDQRLEQQESQVAALGGELAELRASQSQAGEQQAAERQAAAQQAAEREAAAQRAAEQQAAEREAAARQAAEQQAAEREAAAQQAAEREAAAQEAAAQQQMLANELRGDLSRQARRVESLARQVEVLPSEGAMEEIRRELEQADEDRDSIRGEIASSRRQANQAQRDLSDRLARVEDDVSQIHDKVDQRDALDREVGQSAELARTSGQVEELGRALGTLEKELQRAEHELQVQLEAVRESSTALQERLEESTRLQNSVHVRCNRLSMDMSEWRNQLRQQLDKQADKSRAVQTALHGRMEQLEGDMANAEQLAQIKQTIAATQRALEEAGTSHARKLDLACRERVELDRRLGAVATLLEEKASDAAVEQVRSALEQLRGIASRADDELALRIERESQRIDVQLDQEQSGRAELQERLEAQDASLTTLSQELASARQQIRDVDEDALRKLDQARLERSELDRRLDAVAELLEGKAPAAAVEQVLNAVEQLRETANRADDELALRVERESKRVDVELDQAQQGRAQLERRIEAHAAGLVALAEQSSEVREQVTRTYDELVATREVLEQGDQQLRDELNEAGNLARDELQAVQRAQAERMERAEARASSLAALVDKKASRAELATLSRELTEARKELREADDDAVRKLDQAGLERAELRKGLETEESQRRGGHEAFVRQLEEVWTAQTELRKRLEAVEKRLEAQESLREAEEEALLRLEQVAAVQQELQERLKAQEVLATELRRDKASSAELTKTRRQLVEAREELVKADGELAESLRVAREQLDQARRAQLALAQRLDKQREGLAALEADNAATGGGKTLLREQQRMRETLRQLDTQLSDTVRQVGSRQDELLQRLGRAELAYAALTKRSQAQAASLTDLPTIKDLGQLRGELASTRKELVSADEAVRRRVDRAEKAHAKLERQTRDIDNSKATRSELAEALEKLERRIEQLGGQVDPQNPGLNKERQLAWQDLEQRVGELRQRVDQSDARLDEKLAVAIATLGETVDRLVQEASSGPERT